MASSSGEVSPSPSLLLIASQLDGYDGRVDAALSMNAAVSAAVEGAGGRLASAREAAVLKRREDAAERDAAWRSKVGALRKAQTKYVEDVAVPDEVPADAAVALPVPEGADARRACPRAAAGFVGHFDTKGGQAAWVRWASEPNQQAAAIDAMWLVLVDAGAQVHNEQFVPALWDRFGERLRELTLLAGKRPGMANYARLLPGALAEAAALMVADAFPRAPHHGPVAVAAVARVRRLLASAMGVLPRALPKPLAQLHDQPGLPPAAADTVASRLVGNDLAVSWPPPFASVPHDLLAGAASPPDAAPTTPAVPATTATFATPTTSPTRPVASVGAAMDSEPNARLGTMRGAKPIPSYRTAHAPEYAFPTAQNSRLIERNLRASVGALEGVRSRHAYAPHSRLVDPDAVPLEDREEDSYASFAAPKLAAADKARGAYERSRNVLDLHVREYALFHKAALEEIQGYKEVALVRDEGNPRKLANHLSGWAGEEGAHLPTEDEAALMELGSPSAARSPAATAGAARAPLHFPSALTSKSTAGGRAMARARRAAEAEAPDNSVPPPRFRRPAKDSRDLLARVVIQGGVEQSGKSVRPTPYLKANWRLNRQGDLDKSIRHIYEGDYHVSKRQIREITEITERSAR